MCGMSTAVQLDSTKKLNFQQSLIVNYRIVVKCLGLLQVFDNVLMNHKRIITFKKINLLI